MNKTGRLNLFLGAMGVVLGYGLMAIGADDFRHHVANERMSCEQAQQGAWPEDPAWACAERHGIIVHGASFEADQLAAMERNRILSCVAAYHDQEAVSTGFGCEAIWSDMAVEMAEARAADLAMGGQAPAYWR